jgi:hypothetical protein
MRYFGIDWFAFITGGIAIYSLGNKHKHGFILAALSNASWLLLGIATESYGLAISGAVFVVMYIRGYLRWRRTNPAVVNS